MATSTTQSTTFFPGIDSVVNTYLIERCGLKPADNSAGSPIGLVVSSHCSYFAPTSFPSVLELGLRANKIGTSSVVYEVGFFEQGSEKVVAVGGFVHVFVDRTKRRPAVLSAELREGLEDILMEEVAKL